MFYIISVIIKYIWILLERLVALCNTLTYFYFNLWNFYTEDHFMVVFFFYVDKNNDQFV